MTTSPQLLPSTWRPAALSCRHRSLTDGATVRAALVHFAEAHDATGWLCTASRAGAYDPAWLVSSADNGLPLSAELYGDGASLHLRQEGSGWRLTEWREAESFDGDGKAARDV